MNGQEWILLYVVTFIAALLRGAIGMGFALMVIPFYLFIDSRLVPSTIIMLGLLLSCLVVFREKKFLDTSGLKFSVSGRFIGNILAVLFLGYLSGSLFDVVIGVMVLLAVLMSLLPFSFNPNPLRLFFAGLASGVMGTLSSLDGPPIALLYQHQKAEVIRATLAGYFIIGSVLSLLTLAIVGKVTLLSLAQFLYLAPPALCGFYFSKFAIGYFNKSVLRMGILSISGISALLILVKAVMVCYMY